MGLLHLCFFFGLLVTRLAACLLTSLHGRQGADDPQEGLLLTRRLLNLLNLP